MKFIIEPSAASGMIRLPLKKEMKVPYVVETKNYNVYVYVNLQKNESLPTAKAVKRIMKLCAMQTAKHLARPFCKF